MPVQVQCIMGNKQNKLANFSKAAKTGDIKVRSVAGNKEHAVYFMILKQRCFSVDRTLYITFELDLLNVLPQTISRIIVPL